MCVASAGICLSQCPSDSSVHNNAGYTCRLHTHTHSRRWTGKPNLLRRDLFVYGNICAKSRDVLPGKKKKKKKNISNSLGKKNTRLLVIWNLSDCLALCRLLHFLPVFILIPFLLSCWWLKDRVEKKIFQNQEKLNFKDKNISLRSCFFKKRLTP